MTERREWWTDELIEAVSERIDPGHADVRAVIATVEDWHKAKRDSRVRTHGEHCWRWHTECAEALIEAQAATIQRVREVCDQADEDGTALVWLADVRRALDGDSDE